MPSWCPCSTTCCLLAPELFPVEGGQGVKLCMGDCAVRAASHRGVGAKRFKTVVDLAEVGKAIAHEKQHGIDEGEVGDGYVLLPCPGLQNAQHEAGVMLHLCC